MGKFAKFIDDWSTRGLNAASAWTLLPSGAAGVMSAWLSSGVTWIAALGPFGWFSAGLVGFFLTSTGLAAVSKSRLWRIEAKNKERLAGESSLFDPMARVYENKRLYLRDLAPAGRLRISNKKFINCEIIGPGSVIIGLETDISKPTSHLKDCNTFDVDCMEVDPSKGSNLAIGFWDCDFDGCNFYHMTMLFRMRLNESLNWMTPDFRQPDLLEDHSDGQGT